MRSSRAILILAAASLWVASASPLLAADNGSVNAEVTVATPCILVTPSSIDFGTLTFSSTASQSVTYTNCGVAYETVFGKATDASGTTGSWLLDPTFSGGASCSTSPTDTYRLNILSNTGSITPVALTTTDQLVETVASGATGAGDQIYLTMPCPGSSGGNEVMSFQVTFTATF